MATQIDKEKKKPVLETAARRIDEISSLPQIAVQVMEVANDPNSGAGDLKEVIETDAALSARILRCVNSSAYATHTEVTSLQQAIAYLGLKHIRNLAVTARVSELFKQGEKVGPYCRSQLWQHLVSVGICSRLIARRRHIEGFEDAFLSGLLHDIGIVLEDQYYREQFLRVLNLLDGSRTLIEVERAELGFDHTELGEKVAESWGFPEIVRAAIRYHHMSVRYKGPYIAVVRCVEVANLICTLKGIPSVGLKLVKASKPALEGLSLSKEDIVVLAKNMDEELALNSMLLKLQV